LRYAPRRNGDGRSGTESFRHICTAVARLDLFGEFVFALDSAWRGGDQWLVAVALFVMSTGDQCG